MVPGLVKCGCHFEEPVVVDHHGLTPDGHPRVVPRKGCTLCRGSGQTTRRRLMAGSLGGVLFLAESVSVRLIVASLLILGGIFLAIFGKAKLTIP